MSCSCVFTGLPCLVPLYSNLFSLEREIGSLFDGFLSDGIVSSPTFPAIDITEKETESVLIAEMPGVRKEDIRISMHDGVDQSAVDAHFDDGVLTVTLPKAEHVKPKQIAVKVM